MKILEFFKDDTGALSSQRLVFLTGFLTFLIMWITQSVHELKVAAIDNSVLYFLVILMTSKVGQSFTDNIKPPELKP
jgi:hypothetical protein